jgi:HAD superfamily hydrolase (TIGR01456 family)
MRIGAVFIVQDPEDWGLASQIVSDVVLHRGVLDRDASLDTPHVQLFASNPDFDYKDVHSTPRITTGAFLLCLQTIFTRISGEQLHIELLGKPHNPIYAYARKQLEQAHSIKTFYCIGDNPLSDIAGANAQGAQFFSILVRTGVFKGDNDKQHPAQFVCDDVTQAIQFIADREKLVACE